MIRWKNIYWLWLSAIVIILDQFTKWLIAHTLSFESSYYVTSFFNIVHLHNYGAAFSFLDIPGGAQRWLFSSISLLATIGLTIWLLKLAANKKLESAAVALIIGGALGNFYDRFVNGYVIDFLDFHLGNAHWPSFNIADSAVCLGAAFLVFSLVKTRETK